MFGQGRGSVLRGSLLFASFSLTLACGGGSDEGSDDVAESTETETSGESGDAGVPLKLSLEADKGGGKEN